MNSVLRPPLDTAPDRRVLVGWWRRALKERFDRSRKITPRDRLSVTGSRIVKPTPIVQVPISIEQVELGGTGRLERADKGLALVIEVGKPETHLPGHSRESRRGIFGIGLGIIGAHGQGRDATGRIPRRKRPQGRTEMDDSRAVIADHHDEETLSPWQIGTPVIDPPHGIIQPEGRHWSPDRKRV